MFISDKARLISFILSSLSLSDLQSLKEEIDLIISTKNTDNLSLSNSPLKAFRFYSHTDAFISDPLTSQLTIFENKITPQKTILKTLLSTESTVVSSPVLTCEIGELKEIAFTQKSSRTLGIWKGQVEISEDFNNTSSDILSEFGIEE